MGEVNNHTSQLILRKLRLSPLKTKMIYMNTFWGEQHSKRQCELIKVNLPLQEEQKIYELPPLCASLGSIVNLDHFSRLQELNLADC